MEVKIILISGKAQNGKDTVASILKSKLIADKHSVIIIHYADLLKWICTKYFNWDGKKDEKGRQMLQHIGTDVIREQAPNYWVDFVATLLKYFNNEWEYVIIPDCRFPNEVTRMIEAGFDTVLLRVRRPNFESPLSLERQQHSSETALDDFKADAYIDNDADLSRLMIKVCNWIEECLYE